MRKVELWMMAVVIALAAFSTYAATKKVILETTTANG